MSLHPYGLSSSSLPPLQSATEIAAQVAAPHAASVDAEGRFPRESLDALAQAGLLGLAVPAALGGLGEGPRTFAAVVETLAGACASTAMVYVMHVSATAAILSSETLVGKEDLLREIAAGRHLTTLAFSEKGSRSQFWAPVSRMEEVPGGYRTWASKSWVTAASQVHSCVSSAQKPGAAAPMESVVYLLRLPSPGVTVVGPFQGLGLRGNDSAPVTLEAAFVPQGDLLSALGAGAATMLEQVLPWFVFGTAAMANGLCLGSFQATAAHVSGTGFEHTGTSLRDLPTLRARVARMFSVTEQARSLLARTFAEIEGGSPAAPLFVLNSRLASLEAAVEVTDLAMKACGGAAFSKHLPVERFFRDARAGWVMAPTADHLAEFMGRALTGLPLF